MDRSFPSGWEGGRSRHRGPSGSGGHQRRKRCRSTRPPLLRRRGGSPHLRVKAKRAERTQGARRGERASIVATACASQVNEILGIAFRVRRGSCGNIELIELIETLRPLSGGALDKESAISEPIISAPHRKEDFDRPGAKNLKSRRELPQNVNW